MENETDEANQKEKLDQPEDNKQPEQTGNENKPIEEQGDKQPQEEEHKKAEEEAEVKQVEAEIVVEDTAKENVEAEEKKNEEGTTNEQQEEGDKEKEDGEKKQEEDEKKESRPTTQGMKKRTNSKPPSRQKNDQEDKKSNKSQKGRKGKGGKGKEKEEKVKEEPKKEPEIDKEAELERLRLEEIERQRIEEEEKKKEIEQPPEEEDDSPILFLIDQMIAKQLIESKDDPKITEAITKEIYDFFDNPEKTQLYLKTNKAKQEITFSDNISMLYSPSDTVYSFYYILKKTTDVPVTRENIEDIIISDHVEGNINRYLLDKMNEELAQKIYNLNWPEGIKNDLISNMHKFLIVLSHSYYYEQKKIVLYIPKENISNQEEAIKDKDLVARLESIMIEWTNQIRDFLSNQENASNREDFDVNEEIDFLESRNTNLAYISEQLENVELQAIIKILEKTRGNSENLRGFVNLQSIILEERKKALDIHKFLKILKDPCDQIQDKASEIHEIPSILNTIMTKIRVITEFCESFDTPEKVADLIKKVSFQLIHKFISKIEENNKDIVTKYSSKLHNDICDIKISINEWKSIYHNFKERIRLFEKEEKLKQRWIFEQKDYQSIFYELETFEKRCLNLEEICLCQLQFGKNKDQVNNPIWGGTKRIEISKQLKDIEEKFDDKMDLLFRDGSNVLNTKVNKWQEDYRMFSKHIEDLEDMYKNTISSAFKRVNTLEEAINYVENFYSLAKLPKLKNFIKNDIALEVIFLYTNEIEQMRAKNDAKSFVRMYKQTTEGGNALWSKYLSLRMEDYHRAINKMNQILVGKNSKEELPYKKNKKMDDLNNQIKQLDISLKSYLQGDYSGIKEELEIITKINDNFLNDKLTHPLISKYDPQGQLGDNTKIYFSLFQCNYPIELLKITAIVNCYSRFEEYSISPEIVKKIAELENQKRGLRELVINTCREYNSLVLSVKKDTEQKIFQDEFNKLINDNINRLLHIYWSSQSGYDSAISRLRKKIEEIAKKINEFKMNSLKITDICEQISKRSYFHIEKNSDIYNKDEFIHEQENICAQTNDFINAKAREIISLLMTSYSFIENVEEGEVFKGFKAYIEEISEKGFNDALERALTNSINSMRRSMLGDGNNSYLSAFFRVDILLANGKFKKENYIFEPDEQELREIITGTIKRMEQTAEKAPDIYSMFINENKQFVNKLEKKKIADSKNARFNVNSINALAQIPEERKADAAGGAGGVKGTKKSEKSKGKKPEKVIPNFMTNIKEEKEKYRFPKAKDAIKIFNSDLRSNKLDEKFNSILAPWKRNSKLHLSTQILQEEENVRKIDGGFKGFLSEGNSESLISALNDYIMTLNRLKTDDLSNADSSEIPPTIVTSLFIQFDSTKVKNKLIELCEEIIMFDLDYITKKTRDELINKVNNEFNEHEIKFHIEPDTQDSFQTLWAELKAAEEEKEIRFKKITGANDVVNRVIGTNQINRPNDELFKEVENLEKRKDKYSQLLEDAKTILLRARNNLSNQVIKQEAEFRKAVEEMLRDFSAVIPNKLECKLQEEIQKTFEAEKILEKFSLKCNSLEIEERSVNKGLKLFIDSIHKNPTENKTLLDVKDQIKELKKIWSIKSNMNEIVKNWRETQFYSFDLTQMEENRSAIDSALKTQCKELAKQPIYLTMKEQLELFQALIQVLVLLRDDAMSENSASHWEKVQLLLGLNSLEPKGIDFNFEKILELKLENYRDKIENIVEYAREQQKLARGLEGIKEEWKTKELLFEFKDKDKETDGEFNLLPQNKKWVESLENHLAKIAEYKSTPYYEDFKSKIDDLETDLNKFSDLYQLLKQVQDKRNYLKNIFSKDKDDLYQQAGNDIAVYKTNSDKFIEICKMFNKNKLVRECFLLKNLEAELTDLFDKFSDVERAMHSLLDTKRQTFKRFYFLSNDDLFELMGNASDMKVINQHLSKLFFGIERIEIETLVKKDKKEGIVRKVYDSLIDGEELELKSNVLVISMVETWMNDLEKTMIDTLERKISSAYSKYINEGKRFEFTFSSNDDIDTMMKNHELNGQCLLAMTQFIWRKKIEIEIVEASRNEKKNIEWDLQLNHLSNTVANVSKYLDKKKDSLKKRHRLILYNYILLLKYLWELTSNLKLENVRGADNYEWLKLLKVNIVNKKDAFPSTMIKGRQKNVAEEKFIVQIEQLYNKANYGYEYIGNKERLVITGLTERCFLNMMTALFYFRGGSLQGPAGTGKTETIKDLSRTMAKYVIVFNCSTKNSYNTMATLFLGVINTGAWVCFDEFNRIDVEVLSVIRIQLTTIFDALRAKANSIPFKGSAGVKVNHSLAIFITMNPQYIFRSELPENLKTLFRPVALKMADKQRICEIRFLADGYPDQTANNLAKLLIVSFDVLEQELSKQPHYDFSLRAILSIFMHASALKKTVSSSFDETLLLRMAICDILKPKLVYEDEEIFESVLSSVFNDGLQNDGINIKEKAEQLSVERDEELRKKIKQIIDINKLTGSPFLVNQVIQLYTNMKLKHGIMLVGGTCSGKSTTIKLLQSLNQTMVANKQSTAANQFTDIEIRTLFPKAIELDELYGKIGAENTYKEGLLPFHLKDFSTTRYDNEESEKLVKWLVLDAPVDTLWIESLNTLLDDTKMLSLPSGFRINLKADIKIVFEAEHLTQATPATVSRVGLIFFEAEKLSWFPIARKWLDDHKSLKSSKEWYEYIAKWFDKYIYGIMEELETMEMKFLIKTNPTMLIINLIKIFESFIDDLADLNPDNLKTGETQTPSEISKFWDLAERLFVFSLMWSFGGCLDDQGKIKMDNLIRKYDANFPTNSLIYDFYVNPEKDEWATWEEKMTQGWTPATNSLYTEIFVPTIDITRNKTILMNLIKNNQNPFIIGGIATGKSTIIQMIYKSLEYTKYQPFTINLSYAMNTKVLQKIIEVNFEKRNNKLYPPSNKKSICYVDDLNLPREDQFGCQAVVEMLRQFMELEGWYSVDNLSYVNIKAMLLSASTCIRNTEEISNISNRFISKFVPICLQTPTDQGKNKIFSTILGFYLLNSQSEDVKKLNEGISLAMIGLYNEVIRFQDYQPTLSKSHYVFNLHDFGKVFEAISKVKDNTFFTKEYCVKIFVHESFRTFSDRFINAEDLTHFKDFVSKQLETFLGMNFNDTLMKDQRDCIFIDSMIEQNQDGSQLEKKTLGYYEISDFDELKKLILSKIEGKRAYQKIVFFDQAIDKVCILRRLMYKFCGGHGLLIGVGSSGRTSYVNIASELCNFKTVAYNSAMNLHESLWNEFIKGVIKQAGVFGEKQSVIIRERDFFCPAVIESLHFILSINIIPYLYTPIDWEELRQSAGSIQVQSMPLEAYITQFKKNIRENVRIFMSFSPYGDKLKEYIRRYPSIIDYTTSVNFTDWPESALKEVAQVYINDEDLLVDEKNIAKEKEAKTLESKPDEHKESSNKDKEVDKNQEEANANLEEEKLKEEKIILLLSISDVFAQMHLHVLNILDKMKKEMKRQAYFTSQNFIVLIQTFNKFLSIKVSTIKLNISKYKLGIQKIQTGKIKIEQMKNDLEERSKEESIKIRENEKLLESIQDKKKAASESQNELNFQTEKNEKNKVFFEKNRLENERELKEAEKPMLEAIQIVNEKIDRQKLSEFKSLNETSKEIKNVFFALMSIFNKEQTWEQVKFYLKDMSIDELKNVKDLPVQEKINFPLIQRYSREFDIDKLRVQNSLIPNLALYIQSVEKYFKAKWVADVKKKNFLEANAKVLQSMENLKKLQEQNQKLIDEISDLQRQLDDKTQGLKKMKAETDAIKEKLQRASSLTTAFEKEEERWTASLVLNQELLKYVLGNTIIAAGYLTYFGVFPTKYREELLLEWSSILSKKSIGFNPRFDFLNFISNANEIQNWKISGLPEDVAFVENAVIIKYSLKCPLIVDPQDQGLEWIKGMVYSTEKDETSSISQNQAKETKHQGHNVRKGDKRLVEYTPSTHSLVKHIKDNIEKGNTVIVNNISDYLSPDLDALLNSYDKEKSSFFLRTKVPNPKFYPEVSKSANIINFFVNEKGLEEQILSTVVRIEREETETQIKTNIKKMFETQKELDRYEENTLQKLTNAGDNYLEDDLLIRDLENSTQRSAKNAELIYTTSMEIEKINASREEYRPLARKISKYFFVLYSMNNINNMYEFSLKSYIALFEKSVKLSTDPRQAGGIIESSDDRITQIDKLHLQRIIQYANQSIFEKHRLLFALQLCLATIWLDDEKMRTELEKKGMGKYINSQPGKQQEEDLNSNKAPKKQSMMQVYDFFNMEEFNMLLNNHYDHGDEKMIKPAWLNDKNAWNFLISLEKIPDLKGIVSSFTHNSSDWHKWYQNKEIEELPVEWESKCRGMKNLRKLLFVKALRPDKIANSIKNFILPNLDVELKEQGSTLRDIIKSDVSVETPLLIVHGGGVDPSENISQMWDEFKPQENAKKADPADDEKGDKKNNKDIIANKDKDKEEEKEVKPRFVITTLNQDQWGYTHSTLLDMAKVGGWVYIANTHLTLLSIPLLEKTIDDIKASTHHPNFKLIISTNPHVNYPISLLQRCNKITFELPKGIGNNMARLFDDLSKESLPEDNNAINKYEKNDIKQSVLAKLIYSLAMFHSVLIERRKYKDYGWTSYYDFNNSDFKICFDMMRTYSKTYMNPLDFPWRAIQELICANYGSRFTNAKDRELLQTYSEHFFNPNLLIDKNYNLSCSPDWFCPLLDDTLFEKYKNTTTSDATNINKSDFFMRMSFFKEEVKKFREDSPDVFGLHFNAEISSQIHNNLEMLDNIRLLSPDIISSSGDVKSLDDIVLKKLQLAKEKMPKLLEPDKRKFESFEKVEKGSDIYAKYNPVDILLFQEAEKYNKLITLINNDLVHFEKALKGHITMTNQIQEAIQSIAEDKTPIAWLCMYLSTKPFLHFLDDLVQRILFFKDWLSHGFTQYYHLGYFTNPIGFVTAVKQRFSLLNKVAYNSVTIEFKVRNEFDEVKNVKSSYMVIVKGLIIEGGCWDHKNKGIKDENIQDLFSQLPLLVMTPTPIEEKRANLGAVSAFGNENTYEITRNFPLYYIPIRGDYLGRSTYVMDISLSIVREKDKDGVEKPREEVLNYWIKKGTCLYLSKND